MLNLLLSAFKRVTTAITNPFRVLVVRIQKLFNVNIITAKLISPLSKKVRELITLRPQSKEDYFLIGRYWVYKKLFLALTLAICAGVLLFFSMFMPPLEKAATTQQQVKTTVSYDYDDMKVQEYTGVANIRDSDGDVVYTGDIKAGVCEGNGTLLDRDGHLLYEGGFAQNQYSGKGTLYYSSGIVKYEGEFAGNLYSGTGIEYSPAGAVVYTGSFAEGKYNGDGKLYNAAGTLIYEGAFSAGSYQGEGKSYYDDGTIQYSGEFYAGLAQGTGILYDENGKAIYTGAMYGGKINYRALVGASLAEIEEAFTETPVIYYTDDNSAFVYTKAGVVITTDCRVKVYTKTNNTRTEEESNKAFFYLPSAATTPNAAVTRLGTLAETSKTIRRTGNSAGLRQVAWYVSDDTNNGSGNAASSSSSAVSSDTVSSSAPTSSSVASSGSASSGSTSSDSTASSSTSSSSASSDSVSQSVVIQQQEEKLPDFVDQTVTLYFEVDKNVWQTEADLDKTKVLVDKVTVVGDGITNDLSQMQSFADSAAPGIEECVAIDLIRQTTPTAFSNVTFELNRENKFFLRLSSINFASRIERRAYTDGALTYRLCYELNTATPLMYFSIEQ